jgi:hypothetical protein
MWKMASGEAEHRSELAGGGGGSELDGGGATSVTANCPSVDAGTAGPQDGGLSNHAEHKHLASSVSALDWSVRGTGADRGAAGCSAHHGE